MTETLAARAIFGRAYDALRSDLGRQACSQGWQIQFFDFVREHGRKPAGEAEIRDCRDRAHRIAMAKLGWPDVARNAHTAKMQRFERIAYGSE
jgi:hypothetical protein